MRNFFATTAAALAASFAFAGTAAADTLVIQLDDAEGVAATVLIDGVAFESAAAEGEVAVDLDLVLTGETDATVYVARFAEGLDLVLETDGIDTIAISGEEMEAMLAETEGTEARFGLSEGVVTSEDTVFVNINNDYETVAVNINNEHRGSGEDLLGRMTNSWRPVARAGNWGRMTNSW